VGENIFISLKSALVDVANTWFPPSWQPMISAVIMSLAVMTFAPLVMMFLTWFERKAVGRFQDRYGPNRVGPFGLLQPLADGIKMAQKEDIIPEGADRLLHYLAPALVVVPAFLLFIFLPFGRDMVAADLDTGLLFFLAAGGLSAPLIIAGGWAPRNKFSVLGGLRGAAQMLAYAIPMALSVVAVVMATGSLSITAVVEAQSRLGYWFALTPWGSFAFVIFFLCSVAESKRTPFDMPEAESELVAGFHTEYSGLKFAMFFMAEFTGAYASCMLASALFLGGWSGPEFMPSWLVLQLKALLLFFIMVWFRGTLPRLRTDQLLAFAWKFLFPMAVLVVVASGAWYFLRMDYGIAAVIWPFSALTIAWWLLSMVLAREFVRGNRPRRGNNAG
jgi:NADH-quinone oxidoreductase subunit H